MWSEDPDEPAVAEVYPDGMAEAIAAGLREIAGSAASVRTARFRDPGHGLGDGVLAGTDVLLWWGHRFHEEVPDELANAVIRRVLDGMGLIALHSAHLSKPFRRLMGTSCNLRWREADDRELVWTVAPAHPIAQGVPPVFAVPEQEMYGEFFDTPAPDELVCVSSFSGGEIFRGGCCFQRGKGRVFYFSPGHETYPVYHQAEVRRVLANAVAWAYVERPAAVENSASLESPTGWFETAAS